MIYLELCSHKLAFPEYTFFFFKPHNFKKWDAGFEHNDKDYYSGYSQHINTAQLYDSVSTKCTCTCTQTHFRLPYHQYTCLKTSTEQCTQRKIFSFPRLIQNGMPSQQTLPWSDLWTHSSSGKIPVSPPTHTHTLFPPPSH